MSERPFFTIATVSLIKRHFLRGGKVLDVGYFDEKLLSLLGREFDKYRMELSPTARALANERGIKILRPDFDTLRA